VFRYYVTAGDQPAENVLYLRVVEPTAVIASSASGQRGDESVERNCGSSSVMKVWASRKRSFLRQMRIFHFRLEDETLWVQTFDRVLPGRRTAI
jgi:hypothetical protein